MELFSCREIKVGVTQRLGKGAYSEGKRQGLDLGKPGHWRGTSVQSLLYFPFTAKCKLWVSSSSNHVKRLIPPFRLKRWSCNNAFILIVPLIPAILASKQPKSTLPSSSDMATAISSKTHTQSQTRYAWLQTSAETGFSLFLGVNANQWPVCNYGQFVTMMNLHFF